MPRRTHHDNEMQKRYKFWMGRFCCNPQCVSGVGIETHHIIPLKNGGSSEFWNFIALCFRCHHGHGNHRGNDATEIKLFAWKCYRELEVYGFVLDEKKNPYLIDALRKFKLDHPEKFRDPGGKDGGLYVAQIENELPRTGVRELQSPVQTVEEGPKVLRPEVQQPLAQREETRDPPKCCERCGKPLLNWRTKSVRFCEHRTQCHRQRMEEYRKGETRYLHPER